MTQSNSPLPDLEEEGVLSELTAILRPRETPWRSFVADPLAVARAALESRRVTHVHDGEATRLVFVDGCLAEWLSKQCEDALDEAMEEYSLCGLANDHPIADHIGDGDMGNPFGEGRPTTLTELISSESLEPLRFDQYSEDVWCAITDRELCWRGAPLLFAVDPTNWSRMLRYLHAAAELAESTKAVDAESRQSQEEKEPLELYLSILTQNGDVIQDRLDRGESVRVIASRKPPRKHLFDIVPLEDGDPERLQHEYPLSALYLKREELAALLQEAQEDIVLSRFNGYCGKARAA